MTHCIAIDAALPSDQCPLARGECYWRHRDTGKCKYTADELTEHEFAALVGAPLPSPHQREALLAKLREALT